MTNVAKLLGGAMAAVIVTTTVAFAGGMQVQQLDASKLRLAKVAGCSVAGTPVEFPDDIVIVNKGLAKLVAGTKIKWSIPGYATYAGVHTLVADLGPGQGVKLNGVLGSGVEAGHACAAKAL